MSEKPTVGIWTRNILPGSETFIANQLQALRRWSPVLLGERHIEEGLPVETHFLLEQQAFLRRYSHKSFRLWRTSWALETYLSSTAPVLLHAHFGWSGVDLVPTARRLGIPLVVTFHGVDITRCRSQGSLGDRLYWNRLRDLFDYSAILIAVSDYIASKLEASGAPKSKIRTVYTGIPIEGRRREQTRSEILFVGRFVPKKGALDLIRAVHGLEGNLASTPIRFIGTGPLRSEAQELATRLRVRAFFQGQQSPHEVSEAMARSKIFCVPSKRAPDGDSEGLGMVFLEAAASGLPVVSTNHGGIPEAVRHEETGLLVAEGNVRALRDALARLLTDRYLARRLGDAGREWVVRNFDINAQTPKLERLYFEAIV